MAATAAFLLAFALYRMTVVPREEQLMENKYGDVYRRYMYADAVWLVFSKSESSDKTDRLILYSTGSAFRHFDGVG